MAAPRRKDNTSRHPQRRALLVGINQYPAPFNSLKGCVNDALMMAQILIEHFQFRPGDDMRMLTDARATKKEVLGQSAMGGYKIVRKIDGARRIIIAGVLAIPDEFALYDIIIEHFGPGTAPR